LEEFKPRHPAGAFVLDILLFNSNCSDEHLPRFREAGFFILRYLSRAQCYDFKYFLRQPFLPGLLRAGYILMPQREL
jgi:hypothetical protein